MAIRSSGYYNNPAIAQAAENLSSLFAAPSGQDAAGWAVANSKNAEAKRLADYFNYATGPSVDQQVFDRMGIATGKYNPTQSYYAQDQNNMTAQRGQDVAAQASVLNNQNTVRGGAIGQLYGALNPGQIRPQVPAEVAGTIGLPGMAVAAGVPKPMDKGEMEAAILAGLPAGDQRAAVLSSVPVENVINPVTNQPVIVNRPDAAGMQPYTAPGATKNAVALTRDGRRIPAVQGPTGVWNDAQTGQPLPADIEITNLPTPQGSNSELGLPASTVANNSAANALDATLDSAEYTANTMIDILSKNPNVAGIPGQVKGALQSLTSSAQQVASAYAASAPDVAMRADELQGLLKAVPGAGGYDPNIVRLQSGIFDLAYARAQAANPSGEVSRQAFERSLEAFGQGLLSSQQDLATALGAFKQDTIAAGRIKAQSLRRPTGGAPVAGGAAQAAPTPAAPAGVGTAQPRVRKYNPATGALE